jgi:DNA-binding IclR family transcriptional regulator
LRAIREQEVAVNDQEYTLGLLGIAVPIRDGRRRVVAALAFHAPQARVSEAQARVHIPALRAAAERLGRSLEADGADGEEGEP